MPSMMIVSMLCCLAITTCFGRAINNDEDHEIIQQRQKRQWSLGGTRSGNGGTIFGNYQNGPHQFSPWIDLNPPNSITGGLQHTYTFDNNRQQLASSLNIDPLSKEFITDGRLRHIYNFDKKNQLESSIDFNPSKQPISGFGLQYTHRTRGGAQISPSVLFDHSGKFQSAGINLAIPFRRRRSFEATDEDGDQGDINGTTNNTSMDDDPLIEN